MIAATVWDWAWFILIALLATATMLAPGYLILRIAGFSRLRASAFAAPISAGAVGVLGLVTGMVGIPWNWIAYLVFLVLLAIATAVLAYRKRSRNDVSLLTPKVGGALVGVAVFAVIALRQFISATYAPWAAPSFGDAVFHLQGVLRISETGVVFPFGALGEVVSPAEPDPSYYYPTLWHSFVVLLEPIVGVSVASNAYAVAVGFLIWPAGLSVLAEVVAPSRTYAPLFAPVLAIGVVVFPAVVDIGFGIYPFALSIALLSYSLAALFLLVPSIGLSSASGSRGSLSRASAMGVYAISVVALLLAQPSTALLALAPLVILGFMRSLGPFLRIRGTSRAQYLWMPAVYLFAIALVLVALPRLQYVQKLAQFQREPLGYGQALAGLANGTVAVTLPHWIWPLTVILAVAGFVALAKSYRGWALFGTGLLFLAVYLAAAGPDNRWRALTGPFYKDYLRLSIPLIIVVIAFAAAGLAWICQVSSAWVTHHRRLVGISVAAVLVMAIIGVSRAERNVIGRLNEDYYRLAYSLDPETGNSLVEDAVLLLQRVDEYVPAGAFVIGAISTGSGYTDVFSEARAFIPRHEYTTKDQQFMEQHFSEILTDPRVCELVRKHGIYALITSDVPPSSEEIEGVPGLVDVDTESGFELLDQEGSLKLWRITACD